MTRRKRGGGDRGAAPSSLPPRPPAPRDNYRGAPEPNAYGRDDPYARPRDNSYARPADHYETRPRSDYQNYPPPPLTNSYRPPQGEFTFRADKPPGIQNLTTDTYRPPPREPRDDRPLPQDRREGIFRDYHQVRFRRDRAPQRPRGQPRPYRPFAPSERALLNATHDTGTEQVLYNTDGGVTYRPVDELTDSDEAEMDISGDEKAEPTEPSHKRTRMTQNQADGNSVPRWSNPDPYTALPPVPADAAAPAAKKRDVVQLIRKARVQNKQVKSAIPAEAEDYISFDADSSEDDMDDGVKREIVGPANLVHPVPEGQQPPPPPPPPTEPPPPPPQGPRLFPATDSALQSRKRTWNDRIIPVHSVKGNPPGPGLNQQILKEWQEIPELDPAPWIVHDHSDNTRPGVWLHKEIVDFYEFVKPQEADEIVRKKLLEDLQEICRKLWRGTEVLPFGSYPTGLYLPTSDMDVVVVSQGVLDGNGLPFFDKKKHLFTLGNHLKRNNRIKDGDNIQFITRAKVPLVKYVDSIACLKVDISFENMGGVKAIDTFRAWKEMYPCMPILVTLIKQLLNMRGLNEPVHGGLGGFSITCMVVSMLQMMPEVQSSSMDPMHNLGDLFMNFLDLYGHQFNFKQVAICLDPPMYIQKDTIKQFSYRYRERFSIIDPNNPENDVAGGSSQTVAIRSLFQQTFTTLQNQMVAAAENPGSVDSLLRPILGGNYKSFFVQRNHNRRLLETDRDGRHTYAEKLVNQAAGRTESLARITERQKSNPRPGTESSRGSGSMRGRGGYSQNRSRR
ncbi:putative Poly(A) RNA polymerase protein [Echria macrotheca]|uniref:polynucleotide adenylyltransferase n=1 Tax=Echria macrotheca TaxID=438768 RepID=A0AAJ0F463_9PEZI|nr:putative Poly(A) RNA polymerase protein [Echria macrotheca]